MPIGSGAKGRPGVLAIPGRVLQLGENALRMSAFPRSTRQMGGNTSVSVGAAIFRSPDLSTINAVLTGVTRNSAGQALSACVVQLFRTVDDQIMFESISDISGIYSLTALGSGPFYVVAYKAGSPDVAGTTVNTLSAD